VIRVFPWLVFPCVLLFSVSGFTETVEKGQPKNSLDPDYFMDAWVDYYAQRKLDGNGETKEETLIRARLRAGLVLSLTENWSAKARIAGRYHSEEGNLDFTLDSRASSDTGMNWGEMTVDTLSISYSPKAAWILSMGRFQTSHSLNGVAKKSLDRADGRPKVSWTDGVSLWVDWNKSWRSRFLIEYNSPRGPSNVKRSPLSADCWSFFTTLEAKSDWGPIVQRELDITYIPQTFGTDYMAWVTRLSAQWPIGNNGQALLVGTELGYAPDLGGGEIDVNDVSSVGRGKILSVNFNNFLPKQSLGIVWGDANSGWLISPDLVPNESFVELRYRWKVASTGTWEFSIKRRRDQASHLNSNFNISARLRFSLKY
jgi:hypothetical protein